MNHCRNIYRIIHLDLLSSLEYFVLNMRVAHPTICVEGTAEAESES